MSESNEYHRMYELDLVVRDADGQPTGKRKSIVTDSANTLADFWHRNQPKPKRKKKRKAKKGEKLPTAKEADQIMKDMYNDGD